MRTKLAVSHIATCVALAASAASASAETLYGVTDPSFGTTALVRFDSASVANETTIGNITGLVAGQTLRGIDFRPSNGLLYGLATSSNTAAQLYTISLATGAATSVASFALTGNSSAAISLDFNPVVDALRIVTGTGQNYRYSFTAGTLTQDTTLTPSGTAGLVSGIAYTNNNPGATQTTLYGYNFSDDRIITIGGINGSPSPNTGAVTDVGSVGGGISAFTPAMGFDISGATGVAYLALDDGGNTLDDETEFFTVNLSTGAATAAGQFDRILLDISVAPVPEPSQLALLLAGAGIIGAAVRRQKKTA